MNLFEQFRPQLRELCLRHRVKQLEVFGSAGTDSFDPANSDIDFLVSLSPMSPSAHARAYFGLWFDLEHLFSRRVDLIETAAVSNPYFLRSINRNRRVLYAA